MSWKKTVHAYKPDGTPVFNLSKSEAKKAGLFLSVSEILSIEAKPGLEIWKINEHIKMAAKTPRLPDETDANYIRRVKANTWKATSGASTLGTEVHDAIEQELAGERALEDIDSELRKYVIPAKRYFEEKGFEILDLEKVVVSPHGYAGTMDCAARAKGGQLFTLDWKTTKTKGRYGLPYQNQPEQVSSYAAAYYGAERVESGEIWGANAYLSTDEVDSDGNAKFKVISYPPEELAKHWETFKCILELWMRREKYDPRKGGKQ